MAITYLPLASTTQTTQAGAISSALTAVLGSITSNPAWSIVNSNSALGTGAWNWTTLKCDHTVSGLPLDYYVTFAQSGTNLHSWVHEGFNAPGVTAVQTISISGAPTGGTFTLNFNGTNTTAIGYNSTAATVQSALQAATGSAAIVTGGPGPGTPWVVTFSGTAWSQRPTPLITVAGTALTGGTSPAVSVTMTTAGKWTNEISYFPGMYAAIQVTTDSLGRLPYPTYAIGADPTTGAPTAVYNYSGGNNVVTGWGYLNQSTSTKPLTNTTIYYQCTTYNDHIVFGFGTTATVSLYYYGGVTSVVSNAVVNDPMPVVSVGIGNPSTGAFTPSGGATRVVLQQAGLVNQFSVGQFFSSTHPLGLTTHVEYQPANSYSMNQSTPNADPVSGNWIVSRSMIPISPSTNAGTNTASLGYRAAYNNLVVTSALPTGMVVGDTVLINGTYWMYVGQAVNGIQVYVDTGTTS